MVTFAHLADCHIGAWREQSMRILVDHAFSCAIDIIIERKVDFVVISGDLFNTALPGIDHVRNAVRELTKLREANIALYFIAGSHDYSPTGKTMLHVLEEAGLGTNVFCGRVEDEKLLLSPITDEKTGVTLTGILGKAAQLDGKLYQKLDHESLRNILSPKVFLFHTTLDELKPKSMEKAASQPISFLPKGFDYYAGGHVHIIESASLDGYKDIVYPGPLFPASFSELEQLEGGFYIVTLGDVCEKERIRVKVKPIISSRFDCSNMDPASVYAKIISELPNECTDAIVLLRLFGELASGSVGEIDFRSIVSECEKRGAYHVLRNSSGLLMPSLEEVTSSSSSIDEIETQVIRDHVGQITLGLDEMDEQILIEKLFSVLSSQQHEGELKKEYDQRMLLDGKSILQTV